MSPDAIDTDERAIIEAPVAVEEGLRSISDSEGASPAGHGDSEAARVAVDAKLERLERRLKDAETHITDLTRTIRTTSRNSSKGIKAPVPKGGAGSDPKESDAEDSWGAPTLQTLDPEEVPAGDSWHPGPRSDIPHEKAGSRLPEMPDLSPEGAEDASKQLHPKLTAMLNSGFLESVRGLREDLMSEWEGREKQWARQQGVMAFEMYCAEHSPDAATYEAISKMYADPGDLSPLKDFDPKLRMMGRALIEKSELDHRFNAHVEATKAAQDMSSIENKAPSGILSLIQKFLPF
ncbi:MAG: hypothetical protein WDW36_009387 [Sanguina aurantia]